MNLFLFGISMNLITLTEKQCLCFIEFQSSILVLQPDFLSPSISGF